MDAIKAIYLFVIFQFAPRHIDNSAHNFWHKSVDLLDKQRAKTGDAFYLWKYRKLYIRDPFSQPMLSHWTYSTKHPFCWYIGNR